ncbi:hypothetical protein BT96DRAFT_430357 [Gymnopus androsaceus JB14]|uniref:Uncharacterized protein n=1 Tax=Gymnopus androsaceus JB14 TaxID=1447944 RepID=A0A6A4GS03_9AGAR|nr:hypothetical protein BT96DRAFT_430357 [Gymnopus androsaceus JB14]
MSHSETASILTNTGTFTASSTLTSTETFTSTIPGLGATSGKALKRVGAAVVNVVDAILIRRKISQLETIFKQKRLKLGNLIPLETDYDTLLELSRYVTPLLMI